MRLEFLRRMARRKGSTVEAVGAWFGHQGAAIKAFRAMLGRAQNEATVTPAMLARIATQGRALLTR
jgi:glutamate dehydrogenase